MWTPDRFESVNPSFRGVRYRQEYRRGIQPLVDVYMPEGEGPFPSVILIHGGAFLVGSRDMKPARYLASNLVKAGFVVASMDYRMVWRGGRFNESQSDVESMIDWWFTRDKAYRIDLDRVALLGISAGAALMLMARTASATPSIAKLVSAYGIYDFEPVSYTHLRAHET